MSKLDVKKFYELVEKDLELAKKLAALDQETNLEASDLVNLNAIVNEKIVPLAKEQGLNFTADELVDYANERYTHLSEDDLLEVSGGVSPKVAGLGLATVLTLSLGGAAAMNLIHSDDGMPVNSSSAPETSVSTAADEFNLDEDLPENEELQAFLKQLGETGSRAGAKNLAATGAQAASQDDVDQEDVDMDELNKLFSGWEKFMQETKAAQKKKAASPILNAHTTAASAFNTEDVLENLGVEPNAVTAGTPYVGDSGAADAEKPLTKAAVPPEANKTEATEPPVDGDGAMANPTTVGELQQQANERANAAFAAMSKKIKNQLTTKEGISDEKAYAKELAQAYLKEAKNVTATYNETTGKLTFSVTGKTPGWWSTNSTTKSASVNVLGLVKLNVAAKKLQAQLSVTQTKINSITNATQKETLLALLTKINTEFKAHKDSTQVNQAQKKLDDLTKVVDAVLKRQDLQKELRSAINMLEDKNNFETRVDAVNNDATTEKVVNRDIGQLTKLQKDIEAQQKLETAKKAAKKAASSFLNASTNVSNDVPENFAANPDAGEPLPGEPESDVGGVTIAFDDEDEDMNDANETMIAKNTNQNKEKMESIAEDISRNFETAMQDSQECMSDYALTQLSDTLGVEYGKEAGVTYDAASKHLQIAVNKGEASTTIHVLQLLQYANGCWRTNMLIEKVGDVQHKLTPEQEKNFADYKQQFEKIKNSNALAIKALADLCENLESLLNSITEITTVEELEQQAKKLANDAFAAMGDKIQNQLTTEEGISDEKAYAKKLAQDYLEEHPDVTATYNETTGKLIFNVTGKTKGLIWSTNTTTKTATLNVLEMMTLQNQKNELYNHIKNARADGNAIKEFLLSTRKNNLLSQLDAISKKISDATNIKDIKTAHNDITSVHNAINMLKNLKKTYDDISKSIAKLDNSKDFVTRAGAIMGNDGATTEEAIRQDIAMMQELKSEIEAQLALETKQGEVLDKHQALYALLETQGYTDIKEGAFAKIDLNNCTTVAACEKAITQMDAIKKQAEERSTKATLPEVIQKSIDAVKNDAHKKSLQKSLDSINQYVGLDKYTAWCAENLDLLNQIITLLTPTQAAIETVTHDSTKAALQKHLDYIMRYSGNINDLQWCLTELDALKVGVGQINNIQEMIDTLRDETQKDGLQKQLQSILDKNTKANDWNNSVKLQLDKLSEAVKQQQEAEDRHTTKMFSKLPEKLQAFVTKKYNATTAGEDLDIATISKDFVDSLKAGLDEDGLVIGWSESDDLYSLEANYHNTDKFGGDDVLMVNAYVATMIDKLNLEQGKKTGIPGAKTAVKKALSEKIRSAFKANEKATDDELTDLVKANIGAVMAPIQTNFKDAAPYISVTDDNKLEVKEVQVNYDKTSDSYITAPGKEVIETIDLMDIAKTFRDEYYVDFDGRKTFSWDGTVENLFNCLQAADYNKDRIKNIDQFNASLKEAVNAMSIGTDGALQIKRSGVVGTSCGTGEEDINHKLMLKAIALFAKGDDALQAFKASIQDKKEASIEDCKFTDDNLKTIKDNIK